MTKTEEQQVLKMADIVAQRNAGNHNLPSALASDLMLEGFLHLYDATSKPEYLERVIKVWTFRSQNGSVKNTWSSLFSCLSFETWLRTGDQRYINDFMDLSREIQKKVSRDTDGAVVAPDDGRKCRIYVDMLQGYSTYMARAGWISGDTSWMDEAVEQYRIFSKILRDNKTGLWHQGRGWADDSNFVSPGFWSRAQGWVLRGMVETLCYLPSGTNGYSDMVAMLNETAHALLSFRNKRGVWNQLVDHADTYPETSGTALIIHYLYRGIKAGWLDKASFQETADNALLALLGFVHRDGTIANTSYNTGPLRSEKGYLYRPSVPGDPFSPGFFLMACAAPFIPGIPAAINKKRP